MNNPTPNTLALCLTLFLTFQYFTPVSSQCDLPVPIYDISLSNELDAVFEGTFAFGGECCDPQPGTNSCLIFDIFLNGEFVGLEFCVDGPCSIVGYDGAACGLGSALDLCNESGLCFLGTTREILICTPEAAADPIDVSILGIPWMQESFHFADAGCPEDIFTYNRPIPSCGAGGTVQFNQPSTVWTSLDDPLLEYLSCTNCDEPIFTYTGPPILDCDGINIVYTATADGSNEFIDCINYDTRAPVNVKVRPEFFGVIETECTLPTSTFTYIPEFDCFGNEYEWYNSSGALVGTGLTLEVPSNGMTYTLLTYYQFEPDCTFEISATADCCSFDADCILDPTPEPLFACSFLELPEPLTEISLVFGVRDFCGSLIFNSFNRFEMASGCSDDPIPAAIVYTLTDDVNSNGFSDPGEPTIQCRQNYLIIDNNPPVAPVAPSNVEGNCDADIPAPIELSAMDNCDGEITISPVDEIFPNDCPNDFIIVRTWTFIDGCGNSAEIEQTIDIMDNDPPVPPSLISEIVVECVEEVPEAMELTAIDNCDGEITEAPEEVTEPGTCNMITRTWTFTDLCGNSTEIMQTIVIDDSTAPVAPIPPADVIAQCATDVPPPVELTATDACGDITVMPVEEIVPGACANDFVITRTWTFTDECGNSSEVSQEIDIMDTTPPEAPMPPADFFGQCAFDVPPPVVLTALDNCDGPLVVLPSEVLLPRACANQFELIRTWTFVDECGNTSEVEQKITIKDTTPPVIPIELIPGFENINDGDTYFFPCVSNDLEVLTIPELAALEFLTNDNCEGDIFYELTDTFLGTASCEEDGYFARYFCEIVAIDECGNQSTFDFYVEVVDDTPPVFTSLPPSSTLTVSCDEIPEPYDVQATDECICADITFEEIIDDDGWNPCRVIYRHWIAEDHCGNTTEFRRTIYVNDEDPPQVNPNFLTGLDDYYCYADAPILGLENVIECSEVTDLDYFDELYETNCSDLTLVVRSWLLLDQCGNASTSPQYFYIVNGDMFGEDVPIIEEGILAGTPLNNSVELTQMEIDIFRTQVDNVDLELPVLCNVDYDVEVALVSDEFSCNEGYKQELIYEWVFEDDCGNSNIYYLEINIPTIPIEVNAPEEITLYCTESIPSYDFMSNENVSENNTVSERDCDYQYILDRQFYYTDTCGTQLIHDQRIIVLEAAPEFPLTSEICADDVPREYNLESPCSEEMIKYTIISSDTLAGCQHSTRIKHRYESELTQCGNQFSHEVLQILDDNTAPQIRAENGIINEIMIGQLSTVRTSNFWLWNVVSEYMYYPDRYVLSATDDCGENVALDTEIGFELLNCSVNDGVYQRVTFKWSASDLCGNHNEITRTVDIIDDTPPLLMTLTAGALVLCEDLPNVPEPTWVDDSEFTVSVVKNLISETTEEIIEQWVWTAIDVCGNANTASQTINIKQNPPCEIEVGEDIICNSIENTARAVSGNGNYQYTWSIIGEGCQITSGANAQIMEFTMGFESVEVQVEITDAYGCRTICTSPVNCTEKPKDDIQNNEQTVDRSSSKMDWTAKIYPNPALEVLNVEVKESNFLEPWNYKIFHNNGSPLKQGILLRNRTINVSSLSPGLYILELSNLNEKSYFKFIKIE